MNSEGLSLENNFIPLSNGFPLSTTNFGTFFRITYSKLIHPNLSYYWW